MRDRGDKAKAYRPQRARPMDIAVIVDMLQARALSLCHELLPRGVREGHEWRVGSLAGEAGRSMAVHLDGERAGVWSDFSSDERGDALDLVAMVLFGGDKGQALRWARGWLGLDGTDPAALRVTRRAVEARQAEPEMDAATRSRKAFGLWLHCRQSIRDTPVEAYLAGRCIDLSVFAKVPGALRYHSELRNLESGRAWPAMVALITGPDDKPMAVHRTWLAVQPDGRVTKAPLRDAKMSLAPLTGGAIRIWAGASGKRLRDAPAGETVVITEGIEDALTVAMACPQHRVLCAVSLANLGNLVLPAALATVVLCIDNDGDNAQAARAVAKAIARFQGEGRAVKIARSPVGKDFNDLVRAGSKIGG